jgi:hypothetical protein
MPSTSLTLSDIEHSVARPNIINIVKQVMEIVQLPADTEIQYAGSSRVIQTGGTSIDDENQRDIKTHSARYVFINVEETYQKEAMQEVFSHDYESRPIFEDKALSLYMSAIYLPAEVRIDFKYRSPSESECRRWMADMLLKASRGRDINVHDLNYTYVVPLAYVTFLEEVWTRREKVAPYGQSFRDYLLHHSTNRLTMIANRAGNEQRLAVRENVARVLGHFDFQGVPEQPQRDDNGAVWEIGFTYKFTYQRPDAMFLKYPISVHNQLLPERYLGHEQTLNDPEDRAKYYTRSYEALGLFEHDHLMRSIRPDTRFFRLPSFDDFEPEYLSPTYAPIFTALTFLEEDRITLLNLKELGEITIDQDILRFLETEVSYLPKLYQSFFRVSLYEDGVERLDDWVMVRPDLTVCATRPLDPRKVYHVMLSVAIDPGPIFKTAFQRLVEHACAFIKVISAINTLLRITPGFQSLTGRTSFNPVELWVVQQTLYGNDPGSVIARRGVRCNGGDSEKWLKEYCRLFGLTPSDLIAWLQRYFSGMKTVELSYIVAYRRKLT